LADPDRQETETYGKLDILVNNAGISGSSVGSEFMPKAGTS